MNKNCNEDPCKEFGKGTVCLNMASCQSDRCNYNYTTAKAGPPPTMPSTAANTKLSTAANTMSSTAANIIFFHGVAAHIIFVILYLSM